MNYAQQMKHPMWQKKRLEVLEQHSFECESCGAADQELHVHHPFYTRGAMIWEYASEDLHCLCHKCHKDAHALDVRVRELLADRNVCKDTLMGFMKGMLYCPNTKLESTEEIIGFLLFNNIYSRDNEDYVIANHGNPQGLPGCPI